MPDSDVVLVRQICDRALKILGAVVGVTVIHSHALVPRQLVSKVSADM